MLAVHAVAAGLLGACIGSFLNVVVYRLPKGRSLGGRSRCPDCGVQVAARWNVPILGWLLLRGRAACCGARLSLRYPLVEALTALLFVLLVLRPPTGVPPVVETAAGWTVSGQGLLGALFFAAFVSILVAGTFIDLDHRILPDRLTKPGMVLGCAGAFVVHGDADGRGALAGRFGIAQVSPAIDSLLFSTTGLLVGLCGTWLVLKAGKRAFGKDAMGLGDVKLMGAMGAFLGWDGVLVAFFVGCCFGAIVGLVAKATTGDPYIPFGPFLALGAVGEMFAGEELRRVFELTQSWQRESASAPWIFGIASVLCLVVLVLLIVKVRRANG